MERFAAGEADVLVATTVIEVGIDVPNATVMLVEDAERYGISQLHQLRGRVGRGEHASLCLLFGPKESKRLQALAQNGDGFALAEIDLELRGRGRAHRDAPVGHGPLPLRPAPGGRRRARAGPHVRERAPQAPPTSPSTPCWPTSCCGSRRARSRHEGHRRHAQRPAARRAARPATRARRPTGSASRCSRSSARWTASACSTSSRARAPWASRRCRAGRAARCCATTHGPPSTPSGPISRPWAWTRRWYATTPARVLRNAHARGAAYDLVFLDPPYRQAERWAADLSVLVPVVLAPGGRVIGESDRRAPLELELPLVDERRYGDTLIRIHTNEP